MSVTLAVTQRQLDFLPEYSTTIPSGVYPHKIWKAKLKDGSWQIRTFEPEPDQVKYPGTVKNGSYVPVIVKLSGIRIGKNRGGACVFTLREDEEYLGDYKPVIWLDYMTEDK